MTRQTLNGMCMLLIYQTTFLSLKNALTRVGGRTDDDIEKENFTAPHSISL